MKIPNNKAIYLEKLIEEEDLSFVNGSKYVSNVVKKFDKVKVKIVTTDFHALRSRIIAKRHGYSNVDNYSSATKWYLIPISYVREGFAMVKTVLFDK